MLAQQMARLGRPGSVTWLDRSVGVPAHRAGAGQGPRAGRTSCGSSARCSTCRLAAWARSTTSIAAACCTICPTRPTGLRALLSVLAPGGGLGLMVYAPHGRTGVYMIQDALRLLAPPDQPPHAGWMSRAG